MEQDPSLRDEVEADVCGVALPGRRTQGVLSGQPACQPLPERASGPCAIVVGSGQGTACRLRFLGVSVATLADALPLPVQATYLHREIPATVIVIYRQTRTRHPSLTSCFRIHAAASPADPHTSLCHLSHLHPSRCATTDAPARARTRSGDDLRSSVRSAGETQVESGQLAVQIDGLLGGFQGVLVLADVAQAVRMGEMERGSSRRVLSGGQAVGGQPDGQGGDPRSRSICRLDGRQASMASRRAGSMSVRSARAARAALPAFSMSWRWAPQTTDAG